MCSHPLFNTFLHQNTLVKVVSEIIGCSTVPIMSQSLLEDLAITNGRPYHRLNLTLGSERKVL